MAIDTAQKINHVLIIDDDEINSNALGERLRRRGLKVSVISDATRAVEFIENEPIDLILSDIVMPHIDGLALLKQIRVNHPLETLPVIMVTAINDSADILQAFENGANDYITKPVNIDALYSRINGLISIGELNKERCKQREIAALNALIVTYHHELNNPLSVIYSELYSLADENPELKQSSLKPVFESLDRIQKILEKIKEAGQQNNIAFDSYANRSKMVKLKR